ncbi:MAG: hypothetical protein WCP97_07365 [bacterium]
MQSNNLILCAIVLIIPIIAIIFLKGRPQASKPTKQEALASAGLPLVRFEGGMYAVGEVRGKIFGEGERKFEIGLFKVVGSATI